MGLSDIDKSNMRRVILDFPKQFRVGLRTAEKIGVRARVKFDAILVCGMGGSALPGDLFNIWAEDKKFNLPIYIHRDYNLPAKIKKKGLLVICISYSGNTEETISSFNEARKAKLPLAAIASGGKLAELCEQHKVPLARVPSGHQSRMAVGFQFAALMKILTNSGVIKNRLGNIAALEKNLKPEKLEEKGKKLAKKIKGSIPLIYAPHNFKALARIWKINFNESSKSPAFYNYFPELTHNELSIFEASNSIKFKPRVIALKNPKSPPRIIKRIEATADILKEKNVGVDIIDIEGENILQKIFSTLLLGYWASYYLALEYGKDPGPTRLQEEIKERMKK